MATKNLSIEFDEERETKGTKRYSEVEEDRAKQAIGKIYLKKDAIKKLGLKDGQGIKVTITGA